MNKFLHWRYFEKDQIPGLLMGGARRSFPEKHLTFESSYSVDVAFSGSALDAQPCLLCIKDSDATDFFSWMNVYSPSTFPVSQTKRVLIKSDYELLREDSWGVKSADLSLMWSSIILGEILAQGDESKDIESIPISRHLACFSTTYGRTIFNYPNKDALKECVRRLQLLEKDFRFLARQVSIAEMLPCWRYTVEKGGELSFDSIASNFAYDFFVGAQYDVYASLGNKYLPRMMDSSIEQRVVAFNSFVNELFNPRLTDVASIAALLGAAAFLVGRGTSHISLLRKVAKNYPGAFMWFGAFAGLAGAGSWDVKWARAVRSIDRFVGDKFDISDPSSVDLCWAEYSWLAISDTGQDTYSDIPKLYPRLLSVEVLPGANCQLRLATSTFVKGGEPEKNIEVSAKVIHDARALNLEQTVDTLIDLALKLKADMQNVAPATHSTQHSLFPQEVVIEKPKPVRTSRSKAAPRNKKT